MLVDEVEVEVLVVQLLLVVDEVLEERTWKMMWLR